ncbi:MAG: MAPEG family protein [Myxococcota bacterium]
MDALLTQPAFQAYAISVAILAFALYSLGFLTAKTRADRKVVVNVEDMGINGGAALADTDHPDVQRIKRAHTNLLESAVPFFCVGFLYTLTTPDIRVARALFAVFVAVRLFHAVFYLTAKQPFRTASFVVGTLVSLSMLVQVVWTVVPLMR